MLLFSFLSFKSFFFFPESTSDLLLKALQLKLQTFHLTTLLSCFPILFQAVAATTSSASNLVSYGERRDFKPLRGFLFIKK